MSSKGKDAMEWLEAADFLSAYRQVLKQAKHLSMEALACRSTTHTQGLLAGFWTADSPSTRVWDAFSALIIEKIMLLAPAVHHG